MTIDEHIAQLKKLKSFHNGSYGASINFSLETMRKYQKIQEIVNTWRHDITAGDYHCMAEVAEVVEDGNDN